MNNHKKIARTGVFLAVFAGACAAFSPSLPGQAQAANPPAPKPVRPIVAAAAAAAGSSLGDLGSITLDAASNSLGQGYLLYRHAHMSAENGAKLDADEIRANIAPTTNKLQNIVATGNVKTHLAQPASHRTYTVTSDKAVYDPATQVINLTGNVKTIVASSFTNGPFVQTGDSGVIRLGATPDDVQITTYNVHATFTPQR